MGVSIFAITISHRVVLWHIFGPLVDTTARANPDWVTWQYLPLGAYRLHFLRSLLYEQQTPPLPHLLFGLLLKMTGWPVGVARALYAVQAITSAVTAVVLFALLRTLRCAIALSAAVALWFALSTDLYLLELASLGQLIYESAAMLLVAGACLSLTKVLDRGLGKTDDAYRRHLVLAGSLTALAALTRASFSLLFMPLALFVAIVYGMRRMAIFLVPVVVLHGGWCLKNTLVYGYFSLATSSWSGINATQGFALNPPAMDSFKWMIVNAPATYAPWFVKAIREHGYIDWWTPPAAYAPPEILASDERIQQRLGGTNPSTNSIAIRLLSDQYLRAWARFVVSSPRYATEKMTRAYTIYWQPIASYSAAFVGPIYVRDSASARFLSFPRPAFGMTGHRPHKRGVPVDLPTIDLNALDLICIVAMHVVLPLALIIDALVLGTGHTHRPTLLNAKLLLVGGIAWYGGIIFNAIDIGENMRFRLSVEPEIIAFSIALLNVTAEAAMREFRGTGR